MEQETPKSAEVRMTPEIAAAAIADRCRKDGEFLKNLCDDPRSALTAASGDGVPESMDVVVHQNSADHWHIVIPSDEQARRLGETFRAMDGADGTLNDEQLQSLSGGAEVILTTSVLAVSIGTSAGGGATISDALGTTALIGVAAALGAGSGSGS